MILFLLKPRLNWKKVNKSKTNIMKKAERKVLREKLLIAVKKVLKDNKDELKNKTVKAINKSIKK